MKQQTKPTPAILVAHNLLGRMITAAKRAGDVGREFVICGVRRMVAIEITFRRAAAGEARGVAVAITSAERALNDALANDGIVDRAESARVRAALRRGSRGASVLAEQLDVSEG